MKSGFCEQDVIDLILKNIRIVGYGMIGCSECPFATPHKDEFGYEDINISDPDEGHYDCELLQKQEIWGEDPICKDEDWAEWFRDITTDDLI
jgi:hypothetical protein